MYTVVKDSPVLRVLKWVGTTAGILGATLMAANVPLSGWAFVLFLISSISWTTAGLMERDTPLVALNLAFVAVDIMGVWRWLL
jgi:hypothetical protein